MGSTPLERLKEARRKPGIDHQVAAHLTDIVTGAPIPIKGASQYRNVVASYQENLGVSRGDAEYWAQRNHPDLFAKEKERLADDHESHMAATAESRRRSGAQRA